MGRSLSKTLFAGAFLIACLAGVSRPVQAQEPDITLPKRFALVRPASVSEPRASRLGLLPFAQFEDSTSSATAPGQWRFQLIPYLWLASFSGTLAIGDRSVSLSADFDDVLKRVSGGLLVAFEARRGRFLLFTDLIWLNLHDTVSTALVPNARFGARATTFMIDPEFGYRALETNDRALDALVGFRYWDMQNSLVLKIPNAPDTGRRASRSWADPILGLRYQQTLSPRWSVVFKGDFGGFGAGSEFTYQLLGSVGYHFGKENSIHLAYRYLSVDYRSGNFVADLAIQGLLLGFGFRF